MTFWRDSIIAAMVIFFILDALSIGARLYVRIRISRSFGVDDVLLIMCYVTYAILCGVGFSAFRYGYAAQIETEYSTQQPYYNPAIAEKLYFTNQLLDYIGSGLVKLAVAAVLFRLTSATRGIRWLLVGSIVVTIVWTIVMTIFASYLCGKKGTANYAGSKTCNIVGYFRTSSNIVIDYFYALLPVYILWNVKMNVKLKLSAMLLLGMGIFASASTIVKLVIIIRLNHAATKPEINGLHYQLLLWADVEFGLAIFAASLAAVRPLLVRWGLLSDASSDHSGPSDGRKKLINSAGANSDTPSGPYRQVRDPYHITDLSTLGGTTVDEEMGRGFDGQNAFTTGLVVGHELHDLALESKMNNMSGGSVGKDAVVAGSGVSQRELLDETEWGRAC